MSVKVVIFDADHTLYTTDTSHAYDEMFRYLAKVLKEEKSVVERVWREHVRNILNSKDAKNPEKRSRYYSLYIVLGQFGVTHEDGVERIMEEALSIFWEGILSTLSPAVPELERFIKKLAEKYVLCIASDEFMDMLELKLDKALPSWRGIFRMVVTPEKTGTMKPSRKFYRIIMEELNVKPEECVVVGDDWERDLKPAKQLGMKTVLVSAEKKGSPDGWVQKLDELEKMIEKM